jgi:hypothetical protein
MPTLRVSLNGTSENPWHKWGLSQNPFPQIGHYEQCLALQKLGGDPIPNEQYIWDTLRGHFTDDFIDFVVSKYRPGEMVRFTVTFHGE